MINRLLWRTAHHPHFLDKVHKPLIHFFDKVRKSFIRFGRSLIHFLDDVRQLIFNFVNFGKLFLNLWEVLCFKVSPFF